MLPVVAGSVLGVVANPMSGRDIRRLVARASVFPNAEKTNMVLRLVAAAGAVGVETVLVSTDTMGVAAGVLRRARSRTDTARWPELEFCEPDLLRGDASDTRTLVTGMRERGAAAVVVLGGDGTVRAAAPALDDVPVLPLSTGTNNAFPEVWEATVAGSAAALVATARVPGDEATRRAKALHVTRGDRAEVALVDVCVTSSTHVGSRAVWEVATLRELYCAVAEPHAVGLSSVAGQVRPVGRHDDGGVRLELDTAAPRQVLAPIAPGVLARVGVARCAELREGEEHTSGLRAGTVAVDGEREIEFGPRTPVTVRLRRDGPRVVDVRAVLATAARRGLMQLGTPQGGAP